MKNEDFYKKVYINAENAILISGISKKELAERLNLHPASISLVLCKLKKGKPVFLGTLEKWGKVLDVPLSFFFEF